jgi:hypothetical protein
MAFLARIFGWTVWQTIGAAAFVTMALMAVGLYLFGREFYRSQWGPLALLLCALLGWSIPISHTGFLNVPTLIEGAAYPAQFETALSLVLWSLVIRSTRQLSFVWVIVPLVAVMFATHQLGAGLGLIVAASFTLFWPDANPRSSRSSSPAQLWLAAWRCPRCGLMRTHGWCSCARGIRRGITESLGLLHLTWEACSSRVRLASSVC